MSRTVCIVDDYDAVRHSLQMLLERQQMRVLCYPSAHAFLQHATLDGCGCFLFDHQLPELTGVELLEILRARRLNTPAIIMTAASDPLLEDRARRAGALAVLHKPIPVDELIGTIECALTGPRRPGSAPAYTAR